MRLLRTLFLTTLIAGPGTASAVQNWCNGSVIGVYIGDEGTVYVNPSWRNDWLAYCNLNTARGSVSPKVCSSWLAEILVAYQTKRETVTSYMDQPACSTLGTYGAAPVPIYFMVR